jgi:glutaminyl-peptide cyclotransferase
MGKTGILTGIILLPALFGVLFCRTSSAPAASAPPFDSARAFGYLERQVSFGPRVPGTKAHDDALSWITATLRELTPQTGAQPFRDVFSGREADMQNIMVSFFPENGRRILLCAHWDSRPHADHDPEPSKRAEAVPGANDGASGVAVLLEVAHALKQSELQHRKPPVGVDIVFFDGEDGGSETKAETWLLGSRYFARVMPPSFKPAYAVLLDMIGDRDLSLSREQNSMASAPDVWNKIMEQCRKLNIAVESSEIGILDDHVPLIERGIPAVDLIDFNYPSWHTVSDTPDKCSAASLGKIGTLVLNLIYGG